MHNYMTDKLFSIGEVANELKLPVHTIRYWSKVFEHIEFATKNGRRYFDKKAVDEFKKIKELEHKKGISINGIKQMLRYKKIDMQKLEKANQEQAINRLDFAIDFIEKQLLAFKTNID